MPSHEVRSSTKLAPKGDHSSVVQSVNYDIRWINLYPVHGAVHCEYLSAEFRLSVVKPKPK